MGTMPVHNRKRYSILGAVYAVAGALLTDAIIVWFSIGSIKAPIPIIIQSTCANTLMSMICSGLFVTYLIFVHATLDRYRAVNKQLRCVWINRYGMFLNVQSTSTIASIHCRRMFKVADQSGRRTKVALYSNLGSNVMVRNCAKIHLKLFDIVNTINTCYSLPVRSNHDNNQLVRLFADLILFE